MDPGLGFLFAAFFVAWLVLALYLWYLSGRLSALRRELERFEQEGEQVAKQDHAAPMRQESEK